MDALTTADLFLFEGFRLDRSGLARRDESGAFVPVAIGSRALEILGLLIGRAGNLVTRDEIMNAVWPGTVVEDSNLPVQIAALRRLLDNGRAAGSCIQTVPGRGYRFVAPVRRAETAPAASISGLGNGASGSIAADDEPESLSAVCPIDGLSPAPKPGVPPRHRRAVIASIAAGAVCLAVTFFAAMNWRSLSPWEVRSAPRLSIVVLPFANLSNDPEQQYFADGVTEDLTTDLSRMAGMLVISADTALTYRNKPVDAKQIGRELGVRYVVEGSLERFGNRVRVNAQLIDAANDTHLWAERFDREITDLFKLQSEITGRVAFTLSLELVAAEANRSVEHPGALDYVFRGREFFFGMPPTPENLQNAISLYEHALLLDPRSAEAKTYLAGALVNRVNYGFTPSPAVDLARAEKLIDKALAAGTKIPWAHYVKGTVLRDKGRWDDAVPEFEAAPALNRNMTGPLQGLGWCKLFTGSLDEVAPLAERAIRIGPRDLGIGFRYLIIGEVYELRGQPSEAIAWFEKARATISAVPILRAHLASAYALAGDTERAAAELAEARSLSPDDRYSSIARLEHGLWGVPKVQAMFEATYFAGLRKAGMPEG